MRRLRSLALLSLLLCIGYGRASAIVDDANDTSKPAWIENIIVDKKMTVDNSAQFEGDVGRYIRQARGKPGTLVYNSTTIANVSIKYFAQNTSFVKGTWEVMLSLGEVHVGSVQSRILGQELRVTTDPKVCLKKAVIFLFRRFSL
jgi:hypothetical protein